MTVKIYKLIDPFTSEIRYVGKTRRALEKRLWEHIDGAKYNKNKKSHKANWIRQVLRKGGKPKIELVNEIEESEWENEEIKQIAIHRNSHSLTNVADGGRDGGGINKRQVAKLDYLTLEILNTYESIHDAGEAEGVRYTRIIDACSGRKLVINGSLWRYLDEDGRAIHPKTIKAANKHKVGKFDLHFRLVCIYPNLESTNENPANISKACKGKFKTLTGHIWRYLDLYNNVIEPIITYKHRTVSKMDMDGSVLEIYENANQASAAHKDMNPDSILQCCKQHGRTYRGFKWKHNTY